MVINVHTNKDGNLVVDDLDASYIDMLSFIAVSIKNMAIATNKEKEEVVADIVKSLVIGGTNVGL